jgi:hypothetical protein
MYVLPLDGDIHPVRPIRGSRDIEQSRHLKTMTTLPSGHTKRTYARQLAGCKRAEAISARMETDHVIERRVLAALWERTAEGYSGPRPFWRRWLLHWAYRQLVPVYLWSQMPFETCHKQTKALVAKGVSTDTMLARVCP